MKKITRFSPPAVGGCSLMVIFAVLAMCVFAILSVTTAQAEARMSEAAAQSVADYYAADLRAEKQFASLRETKTEPGNYDFTDNISETRQLLVTVHFDGNVWEVLRWQTIDREKLQFQQTLSLWDGK